MIRSSRHRRRHKPPGPCGVLWSMSKTKQLEEEEFSEKDKNGRALLFENGEGSTFKNSPDGCNEEDDQDTLTPPAWNAMLQSLNIPTPYIPMSTRGNIPKRYEILRKHLPEQFILLQEILQGSHDLQMRDGHYLCAWVETVEEQNSHHGIWTVGLKDETGAKIRAWMEPNFVKEELQKTTKDALLGVVRVGVVWMLSNFSIIAIQNNDNNSGIGGTVERMLVVSGKRIEKVWTPESKQIQPNEDEDSPQAQQNYLDWMAKRNALTMDENLLDQPDDEEMPEEFEDDTPSLKQMVGGRDRQVQMTEMSALTMTADDEQSMTALQHEEMNVSTANAPNPPSGNENDEITSQITRSKDAERKTEKYPHNENNEEYQTLLQTQESTRIESEMVDEPTVLASQQQQQQRCSQERKRKKKKKSKPVASPRTPTRQSPKRRKATQSPTRNSPIRMSQSVWNTPDPSILEMLQADSDGSVVDETPTVVDEEPSLTFPTQFSNKPQSGPEISRPEKTENRDESLLPPGRTLVGNNLFEPSTWTGVDATAFSESDSE